MLLKRLKVSDKKHRDVWQRQKIFCDGTQLFLTQPTVSAHIASLEKELNTCLLVRNTKGVTLSENGKTLYSYAEQMLELENKIKEQFGVTGRRSGSVLRIAASTVPSQYLLPEIMTDFHQKYPNERLTVFETDSEKVLACMGIDADRLKIAAIMENQKTIKRSVAGGMGISLISALTVEEVQWGRLLAFSLRSYGGMRNINVVYDAGHPNLPSADKLIKNVKAMYGID